MCQWALQCCYPPDVGNPARSASWWTEFQLQLVLMTSLLLGCSSPGYRSHCSSSERRRWRSRSAARQSGCQCLLLSCSPSHSSSGALSNDLYPNQPRIFSVHFSDQLFQLTNVSHGYQCQCWCSNPFAGSNQRTGIKAEGE
jgi:hypothetical protein